MNAKRLATALLLGVVIAVFFDTFWGLGAVALPYLPRFAVVALEFIGIRYLKRRVIFVAILFVSLLGMNQSWMKRIRRFRKSWFARACAHVSARWRSLGRRWRALIVGTPLIVGGAMLLAGMPLGAIALLAVRFPTLTGGIVWSGKAAVAWLAKKAGGRILDSRFEKAWKKVPEKPRKRIDKYYRKLWFWTMFRIARGSKTYLHYAHRRMENKVTRVKAYVSFK